MHNSKEQIRERIAEIRKDIVSAAREAGRNPEEIHLMAVTKTVPPELVNTAIEEGVFLLGENRVQEFLEKNWQYLAKETQIHFIGHLQTNKIKYIIDKIKCVESVDSQRLAAEIEKQAARIQRTIDVLLEVNISRQESKSGFLPEEVEAAAEYVLSCPHLCLKGLMCIPDKAEGNFAFERMQQLFDTIKARYPQMVTLSMGMSGDYKEAIRYGSTQIRLGSAIFGDRQYRRLS